MFEGLLNTVSTDEIEEEEAEKEVPPEEILARRQAIKNKIRTVGRMSRVMALLREEAERSSELRRFEAMESAGGLQDNHLTAGDQVVRQHLHGFEDTCVFISFSPCVESNSCSTDTVDKWIWQTKDYHQVIATTERATTTM